MTSGGYTALGVLTVCVGPRPTSSGDLVPLRCLLCLNSVVGFELGDDSMWCLASALGAYTVCGVLELDLNWAVAFFLPSLTLAANLCIPAPHDDRWLRVF